MIEKLYKGFGADTTCRGFKYPTDGSWTPELKVEMCRQGYHACQKLSDVLKYYPRPDSIWEIEGDIKERECDKVVCSTIRLVKKLEFQDIADTLVINNDMSVGWFWKYFSPEAKKRFRCSEDLKNIAILAQIDEDDYDWFIDKVTLRHRPQEPWFYKKVAECNPEKAWLFIGEAPELLNQCRETIVRTADVNSVLASNLNYLLASNLKDLFSKKELKEMIYSSSEIRIAYMDAHWILDELSFTEDEFLNFWKKMCWKRHTYELMVAKFGMYRKTIDERYIMPLLRAGHYEVLASHPGYCTDEFLETIDGRTSHDILYGASPRARVKYFMRTLDTFVFNYAPALNFETVEEIETVNRHMKMVSQNESLAKIIAKHPLTPKKIIKRIARSRRWYWASQYARDRLEAENL